VKTICLGYRRVSKFWHDFQHCPLDSLQTAMISIHSRIQSLTLDQGWTNAGHPVTWTTVFCIVVPNNFSIITVVPPHIQKHVPNHIYHTNVPDNCEFTGHPTSMGPPNGTCFMSPFWHLEFGGNSYIFGKPVDLCIRPDLKKQKYYETSTRQVSSAYYSSHSCKCSCSVSYTLRCNGPLLCPMKCSTPNKELVALVSRWTVKINLSVRENMDIHSTLIHILNGEANWFCTFTAILLGSKNDL